MTNKEVSTYLFHLGVFKELPCWSMSFEMNLSTRDQKSLPFRPLPTIALAFHFFVAGSKASGVSSSISDRCEDSSSRSSASWVSADDKTSSFSRMKRR